MTFKVAFDVGGVISKYPALFKSLMQKLCSEGLGEWPAWEVHIISDMQPKEKIIEILRLNFVDGWSPKNVHSADYDTYGEACKAVLLEQLKIDMFFDDFIGYVGIPGPAVRCLVMPDATKPYYAEKWQMPGDNQTFGRQVYKKP